MDGVTDINNPKCANTCGTNYIDDLTISDMKRCVKSCKNLIPTAYIYEDPDISKKKCVRECPPYTEDGKTKYYYIDAKSDPENPTCVKTCPEKHYIDELSIEGLKMCVPSCNNLIPPAIIYSDSDNANKKKCVRLCPTTGDLYADFATDSINPECKAECPTGSYID